MNPANLILRFILEIAALSGFATLAWNGMGGAWRIPGVVAVIVVVGAIWGIFAVPGDPSRSGNAPIPVPGWLRLILELLILLGGAWAFHAAGLTVPGLLLAILIVAHYAMAMDRISWLLKQ